jgi:1-acyl-sn-glycerol-3-phosphate acyltransferase
MNRDSDRTYRAVIAFVRTVFRALGLRFRIEGVEHIPATGPAVLASNHLSYLDFTFVGLAARGRRRLVRFMAKRSTFDSRVAGPLMRRMRHIPVDRRPGAPGAVAYRRAARALAAGELVGVFPEATISRSWTLKSFKLGAAALAVREGVPLLPVVLWAPQRTFTVDQHYSLRRGKTITVLVGPPIVPAAGATVAEVDAELRRRMDALLRRAWADFPDRPAGDDDRWWLPGELGGTAPTLAEAAEQEAAATARRAAKLAARQGVSAGRRPGPGGAAASRPAG